MFLSSQKSTGTTYTTTVALLVVAFLFVPAVWVVSPGGYLPMSLAVACCLLCTALAWLNWRKFSQLTIPSIEPAGKGTD